MLVRSRSARSSQRSLPSRSRAMRAAIIGCHGTRQCPCGKFLTHSRAAFEWSGAGVDFTAARSDACREVTMQVETKYLLAVNHSANHPRGCAGLNRHVAREEESLQERRERLH